MHESATSGAATDACADDDQVAYKIPHLARLLDLGERTVWGLVHSGKLPSFKVGSSRRVARRAVLHYIAEQEKDA